MDGVVEINMAEKAGVPEPGLETEKRKLFGEPVSKVRILAQRENAVIEPFRSDASAFGSVM